MKNSKTSRRKLTKLSFVKNSFIQTNLSTVCNGMYKVFLKPEFNLPFQIYRDICKGRYDNSNVVVNYDVDNHYIQIDTTSVTTKHCSDVYDRHMGERISDMKSQRVALKVISNIYNDITRLYCKWADEFSLMSENSKEVADKISDRLADESMNPYPTQK